MPTNMRQGIMDVLSSFFNDARASPEQTALQLERHALDPIGAGRNDKGGTCPPLNAETWLSGGSFSSSSSS